MAGVALGSDGTGAQSVPPSSLLSCQIPRQTHQTLRCPHDDCRLVQFTTANGLCRKCHRPLEVPVVDVLESIPDPVPLIPPAVCPVFLGLNRSLPVILVWMRMRCNLSQVSLARRIGVYRTAVSKFENGRATPTVRTLEKLARALDTDMYTIFRACEILEGADGVKPESDTA